MKIIAYDKKFANEIAELFTYTVHQSCHNEYTKEQLNAWANPIIDYGFWEKRLNENPPFLAFIEDTLVGFAQFYDDYIDCFYVHHEYQRRGVAMALLQHIVYIAKGNNIKQLRVDASITAKPFFQKEGFVVIKKNTLNRKGVILHNYALVLSLCDLNA